MGRRRELFNDVYMRKYKYVDTKSNIPITEDIEEMQRNKSSQCVFHPHYITEQKSKNPHLNALSIFFGRAVRCNENGSTGALGSKLSLSMVKMCDTGVILNAKYASLSAMDSITRWISASVRFAVLGWEEVKSVTVS